MFYFIVNYMSNIGRDRESGPLLHIPSILYSRRNRCRRVPLVWSVGSCETIPTWKLMTGTK
jgi:hypothetical protein